MDAIAALIRRHRNLRTFLPLLALALVTTWYGLGPSLTRFAELTGSDARFVDMQPGLTADALVGQVRGYDPDTATFYIGWSLFDVAWPFLTYTTMLFITAWLLQKAGPAWDARLPLFVAVAYTTVLMDWAENAGFVTLVLAAPDEPAGIAALAVACHRAKLFFNMVFNLGFLVVLVAALASGLRGRARGGTGAA